MSFFQVMYIKYVILTFQSTLAMAPLHHHKLQGSFCWQSRSWLFCLTFVSGKIAYNNKLCFLHLNLFWGFFCFLDADICLPCNCVFQVSQSYKVYSGTRLALIIVFRWQMTKGMGIVMLILYVLFVIVTLGFSNKWYSCPIWWNQHHHIVFEGKKKYFCTTFPLFYRKSFLYS